MLRILFALLLALLPFSTMAGEPKPDDMIATTLSAEGWVTTKTAKVTVSVNAAVSAANAGTTREAMLKAVQQLAPKGEWRTTSFNRSQDAAGMEQWYATFEARLMETDLGGLNEKAKASSKPGLQLGIANVDFTPTLEEMETVRADLRKKIMDMANKELAAVNGAVPGRNYRLAMINFSGAHGMMEPPRAMMMKTMAMADGAALAPESAEAPMETAQKIQLTAQVTFAAVAPVAAEVAK